MARLSDKLNKKLETSKLEAGEVKGNFKDDEKSEPNQQVTAKEPKNQVTDIKKCQGDTIRECHTESSTTSKTVQNRQGGKIDKMFCPIFPQQYKAECLVDTMREYHTEYTTTSMIVHNRQCRKMD